MQTSLTYRTNRDLFSNHYLDEHLPETEAWEAIDDDALREAYDEVLDLWEREKDTAPKRNESQLEEKFVRPMFRKLGIPFEVEESTSRTQRRPDYGFFETDEAAREAFKRREAGGDFYENAVAVADAKRWGRPLDTRGSGEHERDFENPSYQIHVYLQETPARWAVLTDGKTWRLYYGPTSHRLDSYYEIDLATVLEQGDLEDFKYFYLFFRHEAFLEDAGGDCFLDDVYDESNVFAQELGADLQDNIYEAIKVLSEGFLQYPENDLDESDLDLVHDASLIYLYRLIFVLYAEAEGRELLDTSNEIYENSYSLNALKQEVADELDSGDPAYRDWQDDLQSQLDDLFTLIDKGSKSRGIPESDLSIPAYNGGLFRTDPDEDDSPEAAFLASHTVGDAHLARVVELLTRSRRGDGGGKIFVDYSSLDVRHLGSIYEGLLEYKLNVADEPLALDDGEYVPAADASDPAVEAGEVYLTTDSGERKATGSYYTPEYVVEYIVENTLGPLVEDIREDLVGQTTYRKGDDEAGTFADQFAERIFELKILDPAMGSGHFLTSAIDYLAREIIDAQEKQAAQQGIETVDEEHDINWARRQVAQRCIYGVDLNPLAVELAKVSLWLRTLAAEQPLAFLDHHLKTGNSLVGSDIEAVLKNGTGTGTGNNNGDDDADSEGGQLTLQQSFAHTRQRALEHVMERFQALLSIENESLEDVKEMEAAFDEVQDDPLYQHLLAMANVHTAEAFGLSVPGDAYERMAEALRGDSWDDIEGQDWFEDAQRVADDQRFFHWELEFPVAFYDESGERKTDSGFDAVIGNPPYIRPHNLDSSFKEYLWGSFGETYQAKSDILNCFLQTSIDLGTEGSQIGMITSDTWRVLSSAKGLRNYILSHSSIEKLGVLPQNVFKDASVETVVVILSPRSGENNGNLVDIVDVPDRSQIAQIPQSRYQKEDESHFFILSDEQFQLRQKIEENTLPLGDLSDVDFGLKTGDDSRYLKKEKTEPEDEKLYSSKDVDRYHISWNGVYVWYVPEDMREHRSTARPGDRERFEREKIVVNRMSETPECVIDQDSKYVKDALLVHSSGDYSHDYLCSVLNSKLIGFYYSEVFETVDVHRNELQRIPIPKLETVDSEHTTELSEYAHRIQSLKEQYHSLNLSLLDYLGNYSEGPKLPDVGLFQPSESNVLDGTAEEYENLRIGDVKTERDGSRVAISATARYKPDEEEAYETDRWGYTETGYREAFALADLTDEEAALVEAFVPVAVEEAGGFAGFRETATKTNSLVDRLKAMTLPDPEDVADDLARYVQTRERAAELDAKIEKTDRLIDEIVYDLYDLTDEEIEIVESAVDGE